MAAEQIRDSFLRLAVSVRRDPGLRTTLSTTEHLVMALVFNRADWLEQMGWTMLAATERLGFKVMRELPAVARTLQKMPLRADPVVLRQELLAMFDQALKQDHP